MNSAKDCLPEQTRIAGVRSRRASSATRTAAQCALLVAMFTLQFGSAPVLAQMIGTTAPGIATTTPLGMTPGAMAAPLGIQASAMGPSAVMPTGIPLGATGLSSPGLSPLFGSAAATTATAMPALGTTCPTTNQSTGLSGMSTAQLGISGLGTFDGGGMSPGVRSSVGSISPCESSFVNTAPSTTSTANIAGGTVARTGIPLDSVQLRNAGVSHMVIVPAPANSTLIFQPPMATIGTRLGQ